MNDLYGKLIDKSIEAFVMAIEVYNKPTIRYRVEGFSFFICNAWELMLKANILKVSGNEAIYYRDNPHRTITLENCIQKIFTNNKDPLRLNLEKIVELRNTSTHFITEEYEMLYIPLFQSCVFNFTEKMNLFHEVDMTKIIPQNFLTLVVNMKSLDEAAVIAKYPEEISAKILSTNCILGEMASENNHSFSIKIEHHHFLTKDKEKATSFVCVTKDAEAPVKIIKELKDPNNTHKYNMKNLIKEVRKRLLKLGIPLEFNSYHFGLFCFYYDIKSNPALCYIHKVNAQPTYSYSIQAIDFVVEEIKKDPENIIDFLKSKKI